MRNVGQNSIFVNYNVRYSFLRFGGGNVHRNDYDFTVPKLAISQLEAVSTVLIACDIKSLIPDVSSKSYLCWTLRRHIRLV